MLIFTKHLSSLAFRSILLFLFCFSSAFLNAQEGTGATVVTDKPDYAPSETAYITATGFQVGESVEFLVLHIDGKPNTGNGHTPWTVTDGGPNDNDGQADGNLETSWFVDPDDSFNSVFELTATGQSSGITASHTFKDDTPVPTDVQVSYNDATNELTLVVDWGWTDEDKKVPGVAVFADIDGDGNQPDFTDNPAAWVAAGGSYDEFLGQTNLGSILGSTSTTCSEFVDQTVNGLSNTNAGIANSVPHVLIPYGLNPIENGNPCDLNGGALAEGTFTITYTGFTQAPATLCVVVYDVHLDNSGDIKRDSGNHSPISAGSSRNTDNSVEEGNDDFGVVSCASLCDNADHSCKLTNINEDGCSLPPAETDQSVVFENALLCPALMVSTESNLDNSCTDGDGLHVDRTYTLFIDGNGDGLYVAGDDDWLADCTHSIDITCGGSGIPDGECDCDGNVLDECGDCGGSGIPDGECDCDGNVLDECGVCGGSGIPDGECDCDGNVLDECGVCGGSGIPDGECDCDGNVLDECGECGGDGIPTGDEDGCACEEPESSGEVYLSEGILYIFGTNAADVIQVSDDHPNLKLQNEFDGQSQSDIYFPKTSVNSIVVVVCGGNDQVQMGSITIPTLIEGGSGADQLQGGDGGNDIIYGGSEDDQIYGNGGDDVLIGGSGTDQIDGGNGTDSISQNGDNNSGDVDCGDDDASVCDCDGNVLDECGVCGGSGIPDGECDCDGNVLDECGECGGSGIPDGECDCDGNVLDECGDCGGSGIPDGECDCDGNVLDECGECGGSGIPDGECDCDGNVLDECGDCGGSGIPDGECDCDGNVLDECGECGGSGIPDGECDCDGNVLDECGDCGGSGIPDGECDCDGNVLDECGECGGSGIPDGECDCDGNVLDECGDCGGSGIPDGECDCDGNVLDECGECGGSGIPDGECDCDGNVLDECGDCGGSGIPDGECDCDGNVLDECGECGGSGIPDGECDCDGNVLDECGVCGGSGIPDGECDCDGNVLDECGECGGSGIPDGECDCDGNVLDECGDCGGSGIPDGECDCDGNVLDECGDCGGSGIPDGECDCDGNVLDECGECGGDGIADGECDCDGNVLDECGDCGGSGIPDGECDCDGNVLDECGDCGGSGIPDGECDCDGNVLDECGDCGGSGIPDGECDCDGNVLDECGDCGGSGIPDGECDCDGNVLDECGDCGGSGIPDGECDCDGNVLDECGDCGGSGIPDGECDCDGNVLDECGDCGGPGIPDGECDCDGNVLDECGDCGGSGIPDGECDCDGNVLDECGECGGSGIPDGECDCDGNVLDECGDCGGSGIPDGECDCDGNVLDECGECGGDCDPCSDEECPLEFSSALPSYTVECAEDLPTTCEEYLSDNGIVDLIALNGCTGDEYDVFCTLLSANSEVDGGSAVHTECEGVTAKHNSALGDGEFGATDGALRIYGLSAAGITDSDYFVEDPSAPLQFLHTPNSNSARLTGTVHCRENADQIFHIDATFDNQENAADWLAASGMHSLLIADDPDQPGYQLCTVDETAVSVFDLAEGSFLLGDGDLSGVLQLSHMPSSYNKRFQLGDGVNNHNCNYGLGGWFSWDGIINGEEVDGLSGDIVIDLENCVEEQLECEEYSELVFTAIDLDCGRVLSTTVRVDRNDTTAPVISAGPLDATAECDDVPAVADNSEVIATDNCAGDVTIAYEGEVRVDGDCPDSYTLIRRWSATDVCGNESIHTQTLTIEDTTAPVIDPSASDATVECDGAGNSAELTAWLDSNGGASATDNCGDVTWSNDFIVCEIELGDFLTYKQGTWGSSNSNNASDALDASFDDVFPIGLTVGCSDGYELLFTNSDAIDTYLPCTGGAQDLVLTHGGSDPTEAATDPTCWDNALVSHLITAKLNVGFDAYFPDFSPSEEWTGNLIATDGLFKGMSVIEIIELGDQVLGDCNNDYTPGELRESLRLFNKNFKNGNTDLGHFFVAGCITDDCGETGSAIVTFTATDDCGNSSATTATFTIEDTTDPVLTNDPAITIPCDDYPDEIVYASASDDCGDVTITFEDIPVSGGCLVPVGAYMRTYTATDDCGNTSTSEQVVTLVDETAPVITAPADYSTNADADDCSADISPAAAGEASATDNCDSDVAITSSDSDWTYTCDGDDDTTEGTRTLTRTWTATDDCGNASSATQSITVVDVTAPVGSAEDADVACAEYDASTEYGSHSESDNCDSNVANSWVNVETFDVEGAGCYKVRREYTFVDDCGNSSTAEQIITVFDDVDPVWDAYEYNVVVECSDGDGDSIDYLPITATDDCGDVTYSVWSICASGGCPYSMIRFWTATDECGNSISTEQYVSLYDVTAPELTIPADYTVSADAADCSADISPAAAGEATATDNCGPVDCWGSEMIFITHVDTDWTYTCEGDDDNTEGTRTLTRTWTATDRCDNSMSLDQTITVTDDTDPTGTADDASVSCEDYDASTEYGSHTESDNCDTDVAVSWLELEVFDVEGSGCYSVRREYTFTDDCGNSSTDEQIITVFDDVAPVMTGETLIQIECSEYPDDNIYVTGEDSCGGEVEITFSDVEVSGGCVHPVGMYLRTYTATDECGNSSTFEQILDLIDTTAPELTIPADYTIECDQEVTLDGASATDNCDSDVTIDYSEEITPGCGSSYVHTRTWTATDDCDNSSTATQTITVVDTTAPELSIPADYTAECSDDHPMDDATATDNCEGDITIDVEAVTTPGLCTGDYTITRTFTATDECGNASSATQTITIVDTTAPVLSIPADYTAECSDDHPMDEATATDNCGTVDISLEEVTTPGDCIGDYSIARTFTATDDCGNASSATQTITIVDTTAPVLSNDPEITISCDEYPDELIYATATDNCGTVSITFEDLPVSGGCVLPIGAFLRTYTATDDCGNSSTSTQIVTLVDDTPPVFTSVPADYTIECDEEITYDAATAEDNCSGADITVSEEIVPGDCPAEYSIIRTFTATDNCDNSSTATQTISVVDTTAPVLSNDAEVSISCDDYPDGVVYASATDNCSDVTITFEDVATEGGCVLPVGQYERTYTATDACGNSSTSTQLIILTDDVDPEFTSVPADYTAECDEDLVLDEATASDNCSGVTITYSEDMIDGDCPEEYTLVRTWTATDNCGNSSSVSQTITVVDTTAPQLTDTCGLMNGEEVEVCCEDISGTVTIPAACELSFTDNCDSDPTSTLTETCVGDYCPTETVDSWCDITTPEALADGETCDNYSPHSMRLFNFPGSEFYTTLSGTVANNSDGTQTYTMTVVSSDNPAAGWTVTANYEAGMDWATWSTQPGNHSYKSDCGLGDHTTWLYSMMIDGSASGWGDYAGSELTLSHQPSNGYFGFQIGEGANNKNGNYGFSGWIYYTGTFLEDGVMGSGDIFGDLDCCLPYEITRDYTVSDCAGNSTTFGYTVSVTGEPCEDGTGGVIGNSGGDGSNGGLVTLKDLIVIESLMPNPTSDNSTLVFETGEDISVNIDLITMSGSLVQDLFQGNVFSNTPMTLEISTGNLDAGMYQVRLNSRDFVVTKKLLVTN